MQSETSSTYDATLAGEVTRPSAEEIGLDASSLRRAAWTCSFGSALEYYDFALYSLASALVFGPLFFPSHIPGMGLIASFGTYFLGFAARPFGGIVFGALGDRWGRKSVLLITVTLMGCASTGIGLIPTYATIGMWAPVLLVILRVLQGLGAGAEQAGAAVMMTEYAPPGRRGFYASLPFLGIQVGTILAAIVYFVLLFGVDDVSQGWVWRVPFLASAVILVVALYMRLTLKESPAFAHMQEEAAKEQHDATLTGLLRGSWRTIVIGIGLRAAENGGSSIYQVLALSFIVHTMGMKPLVGTLALICAAIAGAVTVPVAGLMADRWGRVRVYRGFAIVTALASFPVWYAFSLGNVFLAIIALTVALGVGIWGMFGTQAALLPEMFGARHRYVAVSLTRETSAVISGGLTPLFGSFAIAFVSRYHIHDAHPGEGAWWLLAIYVILLALTTILATLFLPEPRNRDLLDPNDVL
uniref:MFS transporter n=1 Tax=Neoasaia chiangmaiensis TaxID=320497 RepID=A0A1U9KUU6_9PROT|nr:MFS transporter [Neoasaia chiangmaiensis]AQS89575.1 MFS transporter [Neoasaia chiangmaiensis]GBR40399.1 major facilitator superfamily alpha-ketoglutarate/sugar transporter [Neoasaia chiangmaiensis NBRC 101099]GEN13918.1 MFS transporter [Neoasaia chiangmaiensis]